jgi:hypothetical protein
MGLPAPTNQFPENKKKKKLENSKIKKKNITSNRPPPQAPLLPRYNFFDEICTFA